MGGSTIESPRPERKAKKASSDSAPEIRVPTLFQSVVQGLTEGWVEQTNWICSGVSESRRKEHIWLTVKFKNPNVPQESVETDIKQAFIPEMADLFDGHQRWQDKYSSRGKKYEGNYQINEMHEEVSGATQAFNVELQSIDAYHPVIYPDSNSKKYVVKYKTGEINIQFIFKDLDCESVKVTREIKKLQKQKRQLETRNAKGLPTDIS